jgi:putative flippase GtrA
MVNGFIAKLRSPLMSSKKLRFAIIGALNTGIDFSVFVTLVYFGLIPFFANIVSTSLGMICSFILNKRFTFPESSGNKRAQLAKFLAFTLTGLWVIQPIVIYSFTHAVNALSNGHPNLTLLNAAGKLLSICVSLVWNYYWYSTVVFAEKNTNVKTPASDQS